MLIELSVRNLAIFEDVTVPFRPGLNVVTGETGAGKSILVEAIRLALGEKADPMAVRTGEAEAEVSAYFDLSGRAELREAWEEAGLPWEEELVLRRVIPASGRSRAYLNGRIAAQSGLMDLSPLLVEMVGQHSVHRLFARPAALAAVDEFAGTRDEVGAMRRRYRAIAALRRRLEEIAAKGLAARERIASLDESALELSRAALVPGEEEEVAAELSVIRGAAKVLEALRAAESALASADASAEASLAFAAARLKEAAALDPRLAELFERARALQGEAHEISREILSRLSRMEVAADRRERLEERLSEIRRLKRKYGRDVPQLLEHLAGIRAERERIEALLADEERARESLKDEEAAGLSEALALSRARGKGAIRLGKAVEEELARVALPGARFSAAVASREAVPASLAASGLDEAELLFSANPGQELRPLALTASGGELSRVMLAIRNAASAGQRGKTMVFDEIDAGIGGRVAEKVGARLSELGGAAQVICVTHLPQIAAFADSHLLVSKREEKGSVTTLVKPLAKQDRIIELARMLSGAEVTAEARGHARELIRRAARE